MYAASRQTFACSRLWLSSDFGLARTLSVVGWIGAAMQNFDRAHIAIFGNPELNPAKALQLRPGFERVHEPMLHATIQMHRRLILDMKFLFSLRIRLVLSLICAALEGV